MKFKDCKVQMLNESPSKNISKLDDKIGDIFFLVAESDLKKLSGQISSIASQVRSIESAAKEVEDVKSLKSDAQYGTKSIQTFLKKWNVVKKHFSPDVQNTVNDALLNAKVIFDKYS